MPGFRHLLKQMPDSQHRSIAFPGFALESEGTHHLQFIEMRPGRFFGPRPREQLEASRNLSSRCSYLLRPGLPCGAAALAAKCLMNVGQDFVGAQPR